MFAPRRLVSEGVVVKHALASCLLVIVVAGPVLAQRARLLDPSMATEKAPDHFRVALKTTKGEAVLEVDRSWAPHGADRFYNLVKVGFFDDCVFFRVIQGFVAQCGIPADPKVGKAWANATIPDDKVVLSNKPGTLSFGATGSPNSRTTHIFVNTADNSRLDGMGFAPFAKVVDGMDVLGKLYAGYGEGPPRGKGPSQERFTAYGNAYVKEEFPKLDRILSARVFPAQYAGIPLAVIRKIDLTRDRLASIFDLLMVYYTDHKKWPRVPGANFPLATLTSGILDKDVKSCEIFFDGFSGRKPAADLANVTAAGIDFTGPTFEGGRFYTPSMRKANKHVIVAQKLGPEGAAPCGGYGICILTARGGTEFIPTSAFKDGKVVLGPKSSLEMLQHLVPAQR
ncbi:MAG: peptidylprolyl isomerase [Planctomycetota bacterium]|nr:peptidylprolyl isomerase [Planctomycetota bacterium]